MTSQAEMLVAFLRGDAAVRLGGAAKWWLDADVRERLHLSPQQVQALDDIFREADADKGHTLMLWRMYQTLSAAQREQFARLLQVSRPS